MPIKLLLIFIPFILFSAEVVWDSNVKEVLSQDAYDDAIHTYVDMKYPEEVRVWKERGITAGLNGLMWQDEVATETVKKDWWGAKRYCQSLELIGLNDWRLPTIDELENIIDKNSNLTPADYWSLSEHPSLSDYAWSMDFKYGNSNYNDKAGKSYVRCVRIGQ